MIRGRRQASTRMVNTPVANWPPLSSTRTVNEYVPGVVGVPRTRPGDACTNKPGGRVPPASVHRHGGTPPAGKRPTAYEAPTTPSGSWSLWLEIVSGSAGSTARVNVLVVELPAWSRARTVNVVVSTRVATPVTPVVCTSRRLLPAKLSPAGTVPLTSDQRIGDPCP